jgi:hypothetical protein
MPNEEISAEDSYLDKKNKEEDDLEAFGEDEDDY